MCSSTIHAQGLERLDGVVCSELDECLDDVEAPCYGSVRHLKERLKRSNPLVEEDIVGRHFPRISTDILLSLGLVMLKESLDNH